ncbi:MAG: ABC transporter permease [Promethearchaeota archaeon]
MKGFVIRRGLDSTFLIIIAILFNFFLFRMMPGDPTIALLGRETQLRAELQEEIRREYGLDKSLQQQFIIYLPKLTKGDLGISTDSKKPVVDELFSYKLFNTVALMGTSIVLSFILALVLGTIAASKFKSKTDLGSIFVTLTVYSTPVFWIGMLVLWIFFERWNKLFGEPLIPITASGTNYELIGQREGFEISRLFGNELRLNTEIFGLKIGPIAFSMDWFQDYIWHMIGPVFALTLSFVGGWFLIARDQLLGIFTEDYMMTARAKGLKSQRVLFVHARKNAMLPMVSVFALAMTYLVTGAALTETVFTWDGLGLLTVLAVTQRDYPLLQGLFLLAAVVAIFSNFIADVMYAYLDPRIRY